MPDANLSHPLDESHRRAALHAVWREKRADSARSKLLALCAGVIDAFNVVIPRALGGDPHAARRYALLYHDLVADVLESVPTRDTEAGGGGTSYLLGLKLHRQAVTAPLDACLWEPPSVGAGIVLHVFHNVLLSLPGGPPSTPPRRHAPHGISECLPVGQSEPSEADLHTFDRIVDRTIDQILGRRSSPLEHVMRLLDLSLTDAGRLFGVSRQAIAQWLENGVPAERQAKLATISSVVSLLEKYLLDERLPGIARQAADAYGGRSMLDLIEADEHERLLGLVRASFDWGAVA